jgi:4-hydroxybenzoate polyprenyl transferase
MAAALRLSLARRLSLAPPRALSCLVRLRPLSSQARPPQEKELYKDQNDTWVDRKAPAWARPYLKLARVDRPIGTMLVLLPGWWGLAFAAAPGSLPPLELAALFAVGAFAMRGAGCTVNDMWDRDVDGKVARTSQRPLASGALSMPQAVAFLGGQLSVALACVLPMSWETIGVSAASLAVVGVYPFLKRVTYWPQAALGTAMNWGILVGWTAVNGLATLPAAVPLWLGAACWTIVYDTVYAHQDTQDDKALGLRSTALLFGEERTKPILTGFALGFAGLSSLAVLQQGLAWPAMVGVGVSTVHMLWQVWSMDFQDRLNLNKRFVSNQVIGTIMLAGLLAGRLLQ